MLYVVSYHVIRTQSCSNTLVASQWGYPHSTLRFAECTYTPLFAECTYKRFSCLHARILNTKRLAWEQNECGPTNMFCTVYTTWLVGSWPSRPWLLLCHTLRNVTKCSIKFWESDVCYRPPKCKIWHPHDRLVNEITFTSLIADSNLSSSWIV